MKKVNLKKIYIILFAIFTLNSFSQVDLGYTEQELRSKYQSNIFFSGYIKNNTVKYVYSEFKDGTYVYYFDKYTHKTVLVAQLIQTETQMYRTLLMLSEKATQLSKTAWKIHFDKENIDMYICLTFNIKTKTYAFLYSYYQLQLNNNTNKKDTISSKIVRL